MHVVFTKTYNLRDQEVKFVRGVAGLYFIFLSDVAIEYPFRVSGLIYIGMSESKQNSIAMRLRDHLPGQSGNRGISNYAKTHSAKFTFYAADALTKYGNENIFDLESFFLEDFMVHHGAFPICNGQAGHHLSSGSDKIIASVDWAFFT